MVTRSATRRGESSAARTRKGRAAWVTLSTPRTLTSTICSHSLMGVPSAGPSSITPALLTRVSSLPSPATAASTAAVAPSALVTSACSTRAWPESARMAAASSSSLSRRRATKATAAPSAASLRAVAAPMPLLAPVTSTTVSFNGIVMLPPPFAVSGPAGAS
jgi:hypothetical protein